LAKQPFLSHNLPEEILPDLSDVNQTIRLSLLWISQQYFSCTEQGHQPRVQPPNLEDQIPVFMSPSDRVTQLYPQAPGSLFVAFYDSQGYSGGINTRLHKWKFNNYINK
jgi:hypothetical protein